jgi:hypothetical protein
MRRSRSRRACAGMARCVLAGGGDGRRAAWGGGYAAAGAAPGARRGLGGRVVRGSALAVGSAGRQYAASAGRVPLPIPRMIVSLRGPFCGGRNGFTTPATGRRAGPDLRADGSEPGNGPAPNPSAHRDRGGGRRLEVEASGPAEIAAPRAGTGDRASGDPARGSSGAGGRRAPARGAGRLGLGNASCASIRSPREARCASAARPYRRWNTARGRDRSGAATTNCTIRPRSSRPWACGWRWGWAARFRLPTTVCCRRA